MKVDYVAKAKSKSSGCRPPLDRKKISQLKPYKAASSISESQFSHTHGFLRKRRHFQVTHSARCLLTSDLWNVKKVMKLLPFFDKAGCLLPVASLGPEAKALYDRVIALGISREDMEQFLTLQGLHRHMTNHMGIGNPESFFAENFIYINVHHQPQRYLPNNFPLSRNFNRYKSTSHWSRENVVYKS